MLDFPNFKVHHGEALEVLKTLPDCSIQCCVTSPPYFALRDYGTGTWEGGLSECDHKKVSKEQIEKGIETSTLIGKNGVMNMNHALEGFKTTCKKCGALRIDRQIGLEETPEEYIEKLVAVFHEVKRIMKDDGILWVNIGDSYATGSGNGNGAKQKTNIGSVCDRKPVKSGDLKSKDLIGIPWLLAFALRKDGWYLRSEIIWHKPSVMPESVKDRCTKSHEQIFMLCKSAKYYYDQNAIREPHKRLWNSSNGGSMSHPVLGNVIPPYGRNKRSIWSITTKPCSDDIKGRVNNPYDFTNNPEGYKAFIETHKTEWKSGKQKTHQTLKVGNVIPPYGRNKRSIWSITTKPCKEAHFATFPPELPEICIKAGSKPNDLILDPFSGSGTTGLVAVKLGRKYIGIELNKEYIEITQRRYEKEIGLATLASLFEE